MSGLLLFYVKELEMKIGETIGMTPACIAHFIINDFKRHNVPLSEAVCVVMGKPGPTGKTWTCKELRKNGIKAVEFDELLFSYTKEVDVAYNGNRNYYKTDFDQNTAIVILNEYLSL